jgi:hypothetical protein
VWQVFEARLLRPILQHVEPVSYEVLADELGFDSPKAAANALITAKRIFRRLFDQAVGAYAADEEELKSEQQLIRSVFASGATLVEPSPADLIADDSALLARMLDLPHDRAGWTPLELEAAIEQLLATRLIDLASTGAAIAPNALTLRDAFAATTPALSELIAIKNWTKRECSAGAPATPRDVAAAVYFAALSAARTRHEVRITELADPVLATSLGELQKQSWIPQPLLALYRECLQLVAATAAR